MAFFGANFGVNWQKLAKNWQKLAFFGVNLILQKFCLCKKNDKYEVCDSDGFHDNDDSDKGKDDEVDRKMAKSDDIIGGQVTWSAMELACTDSNFFGNKE